MQEVLTAERCAHHVMVRGLVRVRCVQELDRVLHFMTRKGLINTGVLMAKQPLLPEKHCPVSAAAPSASSRWARVLTRLTAAFCFFLQKNVIIIGAGAAGLAAARQLQNFGSQVNGSNSSVSQPTRQNSELLFLRRFWCWRPGTGSAVGSGTTRLWG